MFLEIIEGVNDGLVYALLVVGALIILATLVAGIVSIWLAVSYIKYNRRKNSCGLTGQEAARKILDQNGLEKIRVSATGSLMFGNSYSHYFKKVRLRRLTYKKKSITSLAMAAQKTSLAVLDKEGDPAMKTRIALTPIVFFGPLAFIPLILVGVGLDYLIQTAGIFTIVFTLLGAGCFVAAFVLQFLELKTERIAQKRALELLKEENMATEEELSDMKYLFHLYNIEYINNMILAILELIWRILYAVIQSKANVSTSKN